MNPRYIQPLTSTAKQGGREHRLNPTASPTSPSNPLYYYAPYRFDCAAAVYKSAKIMGRRAPRGDKNSVLKPWRKKKSTWKPRLDKDTKRAVLTQKQRIKLLDFIEETLMGGSPVMVGVDYTHQQHATNLDKVTDHWLVVTNREYDKNGRVFFYGYDNAPGKNRRHVEIQLFVSPDLQIWKPPLKGGDSVVEYSYLVTNARAIK